MDAMMRKVSKGLHLPTKQAAVDLKSNAEAKISGIESICWNL
jgi:DNA/RNA-binding domain of Phe-tRNA-synthetase-like protein